MTYTERLTGYAKEKREIDRLGLSAAEYEDAIRELAKKWRI